MSYKEHIAAAKTARGMQIVSKLLDRIDLEHYTLADYLPWDKVCEKLSADELSKDISASDQLQWETVLKYPDFQWDWDMLSRNVNVTWDIIQSHPELPWDWSKIPENKNITADIVRANRDKPWVWDLYKDGYGIKEMLSYNFCLPWEVVEENPDDKWSWIFLSIRFPWEIIRENLDPKYNWNWGFVSINPSVTAKIASENPQINWDWESMFYHNSNIKPEDIANYPDIPWDYDALSFNDTIPWEYVREHLDKGWNWSGVFKEKLKFNFDVVRKYMHLEWDLEDLIEMLPPFNNQIFKEKLWRAVIEHPDENWPWHLLSNLEPTEEVLLKHKNKEWDWRIIKNVPWTIIKDSKGEHKSVWENFSLTGKITMDIVNKNPKLPWVMSKVYCNPHTEFDESKLEYIDEHENPYDEDDEEEKDNPWVYLSTKMPMSVVKEYSVTHCLYWPAIIKNHGIECLREDDLDYSSTQITNYMLNSEDPWGLIKDNLDLEIDWELVSHHMRKVLELPLQELYKITREYFAVRKIQRAFRKANTDPEYLLCKRRLIYEFKGLSV